MSGFAWIGFLLAGLGLGTVARVVLWRRVSVSWAGTILVGIVGAGVGTTVLSLFRGSTAVEPTVGSTVAAVGGSIAVLAVYAAVASRLAIRSTAPADEILRSGESGSVEFKRTARHNVHTGKRDPQIEFAVAKTVAGFLNSDGGVVLIGVDDSAEPIGLDDDLQYMKQPDLDQM